MPYVLERAKGGDGGETHVVVRVLRRTVSGATKRTRQELGPALVGAGTLALIVPDGPVTFVKKFFVVAAGSLGK